MMVKKRNVIIGLVLICGLLFSAISFILDKNEGVWLIVSILVINIFIGANKASTRYTYIIFNCTFFTFLLGQIFFERIEDEQSLTSFSDSTVSSMFFYMAVSLICITIGMLFYETVFGKNSITNLKTKFQNDSFQEDNVDSLLIQIVTIAFYVSYPFYLLSVIEKALYVNNTSYLDYYTTYSSSIPYILVKMGELNQILFALLFCIEYRKRKLIAPALLFALTSVLSLGIGQRNIFVLNIIMLGICLCYANRRSIKYTGRRLYSKKVIPLIVILIPVTISFLYGWGNYRQEKESSFKLSGGIKDFFVSQGGQIEFFANTIEHRVSIWSQRVPYTFSSIYNYFRNLFGMIDYGTYTKQNALEGNSLGATQFYITSPGSLLSGKGAGNCYLSELYFDAGIAGIIIGSIFLGYMLGYLKLDEKRKPWMNAFSIIMIRWIIYIPRASYFDWLSNAFNIWNVAIVVGIYLAFYFLRKRYQ